MKPKLRNPNVKPNFNQHYRCNQSEKNTNAANKNVTTE